MIGFYVLLILPSVVSADKPYTLRVPLLAPISGPVIPLGEICLNGIDLIQKTANSGKEKVLEKYNIVFDVLDDTCIDVTGVRRLVTYLQNVEPLTDLGNNFGVASSIPKIEPNLAINRTAYLPPLMLGSICSNVCKATAPLARPYNMINMAVCADPTLRNRFKFPNLYALLQSIIAFAAPRLHFIQNMGWRRVGIISDTAQTAYYDTLNLMKIFHQQHITIVAEEIYVDDPTDAVERLKSSNVRIILGNCYISTCPFVACAAMKFNVTSPKYVWIFRSEIDFSSKAQRRPPDCTFEMVSQFAELSLYIGPDLIAESTPGSYFQLGNITKLDFFDYLRRTIKDPQTMPGWPWRLGCIEMAHAAVYILDTVEWTLNRKYNSTLKDYIMGDAQKRLLLRELMRSATENIDVNSGLGRLVLERVASPEQVETPEPLYPLMIMSQIQRGSRKVISAFEQTRIVMPHSADEEDETPPWSRGKWVHYVSNTSKMFGNNFMWNVDKSAQPPRDDFRRTSTTKHAPSTLVTIIWIIAIVVETVAIALLTGSRALKTRFAYMEPISWNEYLILVGLVIFIATVFLFPASYDFGAMNNFCFVSPITVVLGFTMLTAPIFGKAVLAYYLPRLGRHRCTQKMFDDVIAATFATWLVLNSSFMAIWYTLENQPSAVVETTTTILSEEDVIKTEHSLSCTLGENNVVPFFILGGQLAALLVSFVCSLFSMPKSQLATSGRLLMEFQNNRPLSLFVLPSVAAALLAMVASQELSVKFGVVSLIAMFMCILLLANLFWPGRRKHMTSSATNLRGSNMGNSNQKPSQKLSANSGSAN